MSFIYKQSSYKVLYHAQKYSQLDKNTTLYNNYKPAAAAAPSRINQK